MPALCNGITSTSHPAFLGNNPNKVIYGDDRKAKEKMTRIIKGGRRKEKFRRKKKK